MRSSSYTCWLVILSIAYFVQAETDTNATFLSQSEDPIIDTAAWKCNREWEIYSGLVGEWSVSYGVMSWTHFTYTEWSTYFTSECDNIPRAVGSTPTKTWVGLSTSNFPYSRMIPPITTLAKPTCKVKPFECSSLAKFWTSDSNIAYTETRATPKSDYKPDTRSVPCVNHLTGCDGHCTIFGDNAKLMYFAPPPTVSRDMCATRPAAPSPLPTHGPKIHTNRTSVASAVIISNFITRTYYADRIYLSIDNIYATNPCDSVNFGRTYQKQLITMESSDLSSLRVGDKWRTEYSFNYADMRLPVPMSAWLGQCYQGIPETIGIDDKYRPRLAVPEAVRALDPAWKDCVLDLGGIPDPATVLGTRTGLHRRGPAQNSYVNLITKGNIEPAPTASSVTAPMTPASSGTHEA